MEDICYATTNRQEAVKRAAAGRGGDRRRLGQFLQFAATARSRRARGLQVAALFADAADIDWETFGGVSVAVTAGASAPEILVEQVIDAFAERYEIAVETLTTANETVFFPLPRSLREEAERGRGR